MERPVFSNAFSVAYNPKLGEVVLNLAVDYPIITQNTETDTAETKTVRENICSVVLPKEIAVQLTSAISVALNNEEEHE